MSRIQVKALVFMKGHSARVPGKNLRSIVGKPLCHWILETLQECPSIEQVIVNTDSKEIADSVSPFSKVKIHMRPDHLCGDQIVANPIIQWDVDQVEGEYFLQTHSTNPLLTSQTIETVIKQFLNQDTADSLFSVTELHRRYYWKDGSPINHDPRKLIPTQELEPIYFENSCIYLFTRKSLKLTKQRLGVSPMLYPIPPLEAVDIDEEADFAFCESLLRASLQTG